MDKELEDLTQVYRDKPHDNPLGYEPIAVSRFVQNLRRKYPKEEKLNVTVRDVMEEAMTNPSYVPYDSGDLLFDINNTYHRDVLELILEGVLEGIPVQGVAMQPMKDDTYRIIISGVAVGTYTKLQNSYATDYTVQPSKLAELVTKNPDLNGRINQHFSEED